MNVSAVFPFSCLLNCIYFCVLTRQTRSLLSVFEEDSGMLTNYTNQLLQALQRVFGAQVGNHKHTGRKCSSSSCLFQVGHISVPYLITTGVFNASVEQIYRIYTTLTDLLGKCFISRHHVFSHSGDAI